MLKIDPKPSLFHSYNSYWITRSQGYFEYATEKKKNTLELVTFIDSELLYSVFDS